MLNVNNKQNNTGNNIDAMLPTKNPENKKNFTNNMIPNGIKSTAHTNKVQNISKTDFRLKSC